MEAGPQLEMQPAESKPPDWSAFKSNNRIPGTNRCTCMQFKERLTMVDFSVFVGISSVQSAGYSKEYRAGSATLLSFFCP